MKADYYYCNLCRKTICITDDTNIPTLCCGKRMEKLVPNTSDGAHEKHVPVVNQVGRNVTISVGSAPHPMLEEHYIEWVTLVTDKGIYTHYLQPSDSPETNFTLQPEETLEKVFAYCNIHGLWQNEQ